jgi:hypothetical protein
MATGMRSYPFELTAADVSPGVAALVRDLAARLLDGSTVEHRALRAQLRAARIDRVTLTGAGLYAYFAHPRGTPSVFPPEMIGGEVQMQLPELDAPAGSLLKVSDGKLDFVEIYTFGERPWPDEPQSVSFGETTPLTIPTRAI